MNKPVRAIKQKSTTRRRHFVSCGFFVLSTLLLVSCDQASPKKPDDSKIVAQKIEPKSHHKKQAQHLDTATRPQAEQRLLNKNIQVINAQRYAVQVYASQDASAAQTRAQQLSALGYDAREVEAQLADQGLWHRVIFGDWSTRMQAQLAGESYSRDAAAKAICSSKDSVGPPFVIRDNVAPMEVNPRLAAALNKHSLEQQSQVALVQSNIEAEPAWALLAVKGDNQIRLLDVTGGLHNAWPAPQWADCPLCQKAFAAQKPNSIKLLFAGSLSRDQADFVLSEYRFNQGRAACWTKITKGGLGREVLTYPVQIETAERVILTRYKLLDVDADRDFELLLTQWHGSLHEGDICDVRVRYKLYDPTAQGLVVMDQQYYKNLADHDLRQAQQSFDRGLEVVAGQKSAPQLLRALSGYGQSAASLTDPQRKQKLLNLLIQDQSDAAAIVQAQVLAGWIKVHPSQPVALAGDVVASLDRLLADKRFGVPTRSCDASALARKGQWSINRLDRLAQKTAADYDLRRLPVGFFSTMATAYAADTPAAKKLEQLATRLRPASSVYKKIRAQLDLAWSTKTAQ